MATPKFLHLARTAAAAALCTILFLQPVVAEVAVSSTGNTPAQTKPLTSQQRTLHALDRLTFGPRPGELAAVDRMGLNRWFEQQLNPASIDDSTLTARLAQYPAMQLPLDAMMRRYPSPQGLKQLENGNASLPNDPMERAMVSDQLAFYQMKKKQQEKAAPAQMAGQPGADAAAMPAQSTAADDSTAQPAGKRKGKKAMTQAGMDAVETTPANGGGTVMSDGSMTPEKPIPASDLTAEPMTAAGGPHMAPERVQQILAEDPASRMQTVMAMAPADLVQFRNSLGPAQAGRLVDGMTPQQREMLTALPGSLRMIALEAMESRLDRDIYSSRQLEAVMTDFWLNHFNVYVRKNQNEPYLLSAYERETIRPNALGKFEDLLVATAESPAMQQYLDNFRSVGPDSMAASRVKRVQQMRPNGKIAKQVSAGLNENYGRELMELHTLGVNGGYTQADVTSVSKVFTGWTVDRPYQGGGFAFQPNRHEPGSKTVLGKTIKEDGMKEGLEVLHMLATSPATAHFISEKLAIRFVSDTPPPALVDKMAATFLKTDGDIKAVLRTMFYAPEFWSPAVYRAKVKTPLEFVVSAVRASDLKVASTQALVQSLDKLGMPLYGMQTPQGYSWKKDEWVSTGALVSRMNFSLVMAGDRIPGTRTEWTTLLAEPQTPGNQAAITPASYSGAESAEAKEHRLEMLLLGAPASERTRATVLSQSGDTNVTEQAATQFDLSGKGKSNYAGRGLGRMANGGGADDPQAAVMAGLLLGSPEFQRR